MLKASEYCIAKLITRAARLHDSAVEVLAGDVEEEMGHLHQDLMGCQEMEISIQFENYSMLCNNLSDQQTALPLHIHSIHAVAIARHSKVIQGKQVHVLSR